MGIGEAAYGLMAAFDAEEWCDRKEGIARELRHLAREIERIARAPHGPPDGAPVTKVEIDLQEKTSGMISDDKCHGYRVRKVEWYGELHFKKYGLSWKTGEWLLVPEGGHYPEETFLEVKEGS